MSHDEELFTHTVNAGTVGDLPKALDGAPDDLPPIVFVADEPGGNTVDEQVVTGAGLRNDKGPEGAPPDSFEIGCEFPSGEYYRRTR
jgi:hypothetical protein